MRALGPMIRWRPFPLAQSFLVGVSATTTRGQNTAQSMAATEAAAGHQSVKRVYANNDFATFATTALISGDLDMAAKTSVRTTHLSWNPDAVLLQSENPPNSAAKFSGFDATLGFNAWKAGGYQGTVTGYGPETTKNLTALRTIPDWHKVILNPWHEADEYQADRSYGTNYGAFRNGFRIIADMIHAFGNPNWQTCLLLTAFGFKGSGGSDRYPSNFWPAWANDLPSGHRYVDVMGVDLYNEGSIRSSSYQWDSPGACIGIPFDAAERATYQARYGGTSGWKTSEPNSTLTWTNGFLGWMEAIGVTKWIIGELGSALNVSDVTPQWVNTLGIPNTKNAWIQQFGDFLALYNADPTHKAKCIGVEYFMSAGRTLPDKDLYVHDRTTGARILGLKGYAKTADALPTTGNTTGDQWFVAAATLGDVYQWSGTAWADTGQNGIRESWQLWWNDDGTGWDGANSGYTAWKYVTARYGTT